MCLMYLIIWAYLTLDILDYMTIFEFEYTVLLYLSISEFWYIYIDSNTLYSSVLECEYIRLHILIE